MNRNLLVSILLVVALLFVSCTTAKVEIPLTSAKIVWDNSTDYALQTEFAVSEIKAAFERANVKEETNPTWTIELKGLDESLGEQGYKVEVSANTISITGGDRTGLMYGGLEVAEQIRVYRGIDKVSSCSGTPYSKNRGIKFNIPLDMRTPSYTDAGTAAQENIKNMWDMEYWHEYLDELARNRFNVLSIWNLNPFASMVKVPEFSEIALDDVWRTTIEFDDYYKKNATDIVREEQWDNYEIVKKMTIDEKIEFWREVMQYAKDRGIDFYIFTWNIYTFAERGQYGITNDMDNQTTIDYYRASVRELVKAYPLLKGVGITAGENMSFDIGGEEGEKWLYSTYGLGIMDALKDDPEREFTFFHRLHYSDFETVQRIWADFPRTIEFSDKSSTAHMLSSSNPQEAAENLLLLPKGSYLRYEFRTDDNYHFKFGDIDYVREYTKNTVGNTEQISGFFMGADGYVTGREVTALKPQSPRELYNKQHFIEYLLFSRLSYDNNLPDERVAAILSEKYGYRDGDLMLELLVNAGKVIPLQNQLTWFAGDSFCPEVDYNDPSTFGYYGINNAIKNNATQKGAKKLSIVESVNNFEDGIATPEGFMSAFDVAESQKVHATRALELIEALKKQKKVKEAANEFELFLQDQEAMAYLGLYYSNKNYATLYLRLYNDLQDKSYHEKAIACSKDAYSYYEKYAQIYTSRLAPEILGRIGILDVNEVLKSVEKDITVVQNWKIRPLRLK